MRQSINIEGLDLAAGSQVGLADREGHVATATVVRLARLGELPTGTTVIDPYTGDLMTVERDGYAVNLRECPGSLWGADPQQVAPVIQLHDQAQSRAAA